jgi:hypothetical protein
MLITGFGLPIFITWMGYLPIIAPLLAKVRPYVTWPSSITRYHIRPLPYLVGKAPTVGQSLYVAMFLILNIIFTAISYESRQPNAWNPTVHYEIMSYLLGRTGIFAYTFLPLVFLFAGRNNILLWLTNWSHSTYLVLHRWIARIFTVQVLLHSLISLAKYKQTGMYSMESVKPYWIWGIVATLCVVVLCFGSGLYIRNKHYEIFLLSHIALSVILVVGCWYHAYDLYGLLGGYVYWVYAVSAVWAFDRVVRALRIGIVGTKMSTIREMDSDLGYVRIDVPDVRWSLGPGMHAYLYFPTVSRWAPWESHPFSVMPTAMLTPRTRDDSITTDHLSRLGEKTNGSADSAGSDQDVEKTSAVVQTHGQMQSARSTSGLTFFVKKGEGFTKKLHAQTDLLTLVEGPYPNNSSGQVLLCDRLLLIAGGIGITAVVSFIANHQNVKLSWSVRENAHCLVSEIDGLLSTLVDKDVRIGSRLDVVSLLAQEVRAGWQKVGVVISGPPSFCDDAKAAVIEQARISKTTQFELEVEAYSW